MFVAHYENTMRGAKLKMAPPKPIALAPKHMALPVNNNVEPRVERPEFPTLAEFNRLVQRVVALELAAARIELTPITPIPRRTIDYATIARRICRVFHVKKDELLSHRRDRRIMFARQAIMYWSCRLTSTSMPMIARLMHRDHTTVIHGRHAYVEKRARMGRTLRALDRRHAAAGE